MLGPLSRPVLLLALLLAFVPACTSDGDTGLPGDIVGASLLAAGASANFALGAMEDRANWQGCVAAAVVADVAPEIAIMAFTDGEVPVTLDVGMEYCEDVAGAPTDWPGFESQAAASVIEGIDDILRAAEVLGARLPPCEEAWFAAAVQTMRSVRPSVEAYMRDGKSSVTATWPGVPASACED